MDLIYRVGKDIKYDYTERISGLIRIRTIGIVQFQSTIDEFQSNCQCDYHITACFPTAHNVTRYCLLVLENNHSEKNRLWSEKFDLAILCYIPFNNHIFAKQTTINNLCYDLYTGKHLKNNPSFTPPTFFYQALLSLLKTLTKTDNESTFLPLVLSAHYILYIIIPKIDLKYHKWLLSRHFPSCKRTN